MGTCHSAAHRQPQSIVVPARLVTLSALAGVPSGSSLYRRVRMMRTPAIDPASPTHHLRHSLKFAGRPDVRPWTAVMYCAGLPLTVVRCGHESGRTPLGYPDAIRSKNNVAFPPIDALLGGSLISPMSVRAGSFLQWRIHATVYCRLLVTRTFACSDLQYVVL